MAQRKSTRTPKGNGTWSVKREAGSGKFMDATEVSQKGGKISRVSERVIKETSHKRREAMKALANR
jgi:hypothetical protein